MSNGGILFASRKSMTFSAFYAHQYSLIASKGLVIPKLYSFQTCQEFSWRTETHSKHRQAYKMKFLSK